MYSEPSLTKMNGNGKSLLLGRPFDLRSLLTSSNDSIPYIYFILLFSTIISVGVSYARLLTKGKNPVLKRALSFQFLKVMIMLILKFTVQSYVLSIAVKSMMFKFVSKVSSVILLCASYKCKSNKRISV